MKGYRLKKESIYLDTSVPSAFYDKRSRERQEVTIKFWNEKLPKYDIHISDLTIEESKNTKDEDLRKKFFVLINNFIVLDSNNSTKELARMYVENGIFPLKYFDDAQHVAIASYNEINYLISWNFEHLVKVKTRRSVNFVNFRNGFREIEIISPQEL